nr:DUF4433 domain-containing protein [Endozoicomonas sp. YOMI1]
MDNGLHSGNSKLHSPEWVPIGNPELTDKRTRYVVPIAPGGVLNDYVPFYFTPRSVMMMNIVTGRGVKQRQREEIVILVSSLHQLQRQGLPFVFTDSHAYCQWAPFYHDLADLPNIDWPLLQSLDFRRVPDDPARFERYQAEALVHQHCPVSALIGMICYSDDITMEVTQQIQQRGLTLPVYTRPGCYHP